MDTGTHVVMGVGLSGLAMLDPAIASSPAATETVLIGTLIGSVAPDFDTLFKLKDNAIYIRQHRGVSHSMPAILIWSLLIWGALTVFSPAVPGLHLWLWTLAAVCLHVFVDLFNAYGTQALRPFSNRWVAFGVINIFDPMIFFSHAVGIVLWMLHLSPPAATFIAVYLLLFLYYVWRFSVYGIVKKRVVKKFPDAEYVNLSPTFLWTQWHVSVRTSDSYYVLQAIWGNLILFNRFKRRPLSESGVTDDMKKDENIRAFMNFSPIYTWEKTEYPNYTEIRLIDLRYRNKDGHFPFVAIVFLDEQNHIVSSFTGWVHSERKLQKKLELEMNVN